MKNKPNILTIAGFDPSNGAGLTADVKTFETLRCYGFSVCTANTIQNDVAFKACHWIPKDIIKSQIGILFERFEIDFVKIGIVENWHTLSFIIDELLALNSKIKIVLDPVLKSSTHFDFNTEVYSSKMEKKIEEILSKIYLITPNYNEIQQLYPTKNIEETITHISNLTNLFLKGGHNEKAIGKDQLFTKNGKRFNLNPKLKNCSEKHGSGCIVSAAITSYLALGFPLLKSCYRGKRYIEKVLSSNTGLLGTHSKY